MHQCKRFNLGSSIVGSISVWMLNGPILRVVFGNKSNNLESWVSFMDTDNICRFYGKYWAIETFFRSIKQHLRLSPVFQMRSFSAYIAYTNVSRTNTELSQSFLQPPYDSFRCFPSPECFRSSWGKGSVISPAARRPDYLNQPASYVELPNRIRKFGCCL